VNPAERSCSLNAVRQSLGKVRYERHRGREIALTDAICPNDLRLGIERNEGVLIANTARVVVLRDVPLLLADVGPNLIDLDTAARKLAHFLVH
jgi:hypothetical protein